MHPLPFDTLVGDLDLLYCAVTHRLRRLAEADQIAAPAFEPVDALRAGVLDCVTALDQLRAMVAHEFVSVLGPALRMPSDRADL